MFNRKKVKKLQAALLSVTEVAQKRTVEAESLKRELSNMCHRYRTLHNKAYPSKEFVKFLPNYPGEYYTIAAPSHIITEWQNEKEACLTTVEREKVIMRPLELGGQELLVGRSKFTDVWYFYLGEKND